MYSHGRHRHHDQHRTFVWAWVMTKAAENSAKARPTLNF